jgi:hypothetical protein
MLGTDFDSLFGRWSTQGAWYYVIGRLHMRPELTVDEVIGEYISAFGKAAPAIRKYLAYWEDFTATRTAKVAPGMYNIVGKMPELFTEEALAPAQALLVEAARLARGDSETARARVEFLRDGLTHVRLTRDAIAKVAAARMAGVIADAPALVRTVEKLREFRRKAAPEHQDWTEWSNLWEIRMGDQSGMRLTAGLHGRIPTAALPLKWKEAKAGGAITYETAFTAPAGPSKRTLLFGGVGGEATVWLNGKPAGGGKGTFEVRDLELVKGQNTILVRVEGPAGDFRPVWILGD